MYVVKRLEIRKNTRENKISLTARKKDSDEELFPSKENNTNVTPGKHQYSNSNYQPFPTNDRVSVRSN